VISQIYGGGGNVGALYNSDFVELHNRTGQNADVSSWALQYASAAGTTWTAALIPANTVIAPGGYLLLALGPAGANGASLPAQALPLSRTIDISASNGKVALTSSSSPLAGSCPPDTSIVDFVGYGTANCAEGGAAAPALSSGFAAFRLSMSAPSQACADSAVNSADFAKAAPSPHGSASNVCACP
jgi:hypothetical protein